MPPKKQPSFRELARHHPVFQAETVRIEPLPAMAGMIGARPEQELTQPDAGVSLTCVEAPLFLPTGPLAEGSRPEVPRPARRPARPPALPTRSLRAQHPGPASRAGAEIPHHPRPPRRPPPHPAVRTAKAQPLPAPAMLTSRPPAPRNPAPQLRHARLVPVPSFDLRAVRADAEARRAKAPAGRRGLWARIAALLARCYFFFLPSTRR